MGHVPHSSSLAGPSEQAGLKDCLSLAGKEGRQISSDCSELLLSEKGQEAYRKQHEAMTSVVRSILEELVLS